MKAWRLTSPKRFELLNVDVPSPKQGECLIKLEKLSICGSDIFLEYNTVQEEKYPMHIGAPCHECAGVVVESRTDAFKEAQRVIVLPERSSGLVEYVVSSPGRMVRLPDWGPLDEWVICQPSGTALYACKQMGNVVGKSVLMLGQGAIGLSITMFLERLGAIQIIAADLYDYRLAKAKEFGATDTINPGRVNIDEAVKELTRGEGPDYVVDASGNPSGLDDSIRLVKHRGTVFGFSLVTSETVPIHHFKWMLKEVRIVPTTSALSGTPTLAIEEMVALKARGWADPGRLITHRKSWLEVPECYNMYEKRLDNVIKVVMDVTH